jgi:protein-S-isoprenylcysteine O-methyltransferase Ste14
MDKLIIPALKSTVVGVVLLGLLLFLPAGTLNYWQAWVLIAIFVLGSIAIGIYLSIHDPVLLERRKQAGPLAESRPAQKIIILILIAALVGMLVLSALDHRFGWSEIPEPVSLVGQVLAAIGLYITLPRGQGEQLQRLDGQGIQGPEGYFHRTLRPGAPSDVYGDTSLGTGFAGGTWLVVGLPAGSARHTGAGLADFR